MVVIGILIKERAVLIMNTKAFDKLNYTMAVIGAAADGKRHGCIVNSLVQVASSFPAKFTVSVHKDHDTCDAIAAAGSFAVTLLAKDCPKDVVNTFGYKSGRVGDKFADFAAKEDAAGNPYLTEHMVARISCKVVGQMEVGKYILFVAEATDSEILGSGQAMTLDDFTGAGATTPVTATIYRTLDANYGWKCTVCGYIYEGDEVPDDYQCPICRAPKSKFVKR